MFVWKAIESIMPTISPTRFVLVRIDSMFSTTRVAASMPRLVASVAVLAMRCVSRAVSWFCRTLAVSSSMLAAASSMAFAWPSVRAERSRLPSPRLRTSEPIVSEAARTSPTMRASPWVMWFRERMSRAVSSRPRISSTRVRSPAATRCATSAAFAIEARTERMRKKAKSAAIPTTSRFAPTRRLRRDVRSSTRESSRRISSWCRRSYIPSARPIDSSLS